MSRTVRFRRDCQREYEDAVDWYERRQDGLGSRFYDTVQRVLAELAEQPDRYPIVEEDVRQAPVPDFPYYSVFYRDQRTHILVVSVFHQSRDPSVWRSRI